MNSIREAKEALRRKLGQYRLDRPFRTAILGDGLGNIRVPQSPDYVWARDSADSTEYYPVMNRSAVSYEINLPVIIGYPDTEPNQEQIIGVNYSGLGTGQTSTTIAPIGLHSRQHEFRGGDDVALDSRQFTPGLVCPTDPPSMSVVVKSFVFQWDNRWFNFDETTTPDLSAYRPDGGLTSILLITLDPQSQSLRYRPGPPYNAGFDTSSVVNHMISAPWPEIALGYALLQGNVSTIDWTQSQDQIGDARTHAAAPLQHLTDRISAVEGYLGSDPNIATLGAAASQTGGINRTLSGLIDVFVAGATNGQGLAYESSTNRWTAQTILGAASTHQIISSTHTDSASAVSPVAGDLLAYRASQWTPESGIDIGSDSASLAAINFTIQGSAPSAPGVGHLSLFSFGGSFYSLNASGASVAIGGATSFTSLYDAPSTFSGHSREFVTVNASATALTFRTAQYRQFLYTVASGASDFQFLTDASGNPLMGLLDLE